MATVMDKIIDKSQIVFISGKNIHNNIICAQEIFFKTRKRKTKEYYLKLILKKRLNLM
jgi:hypothetical protein